MSRKFNVQNAEAAPSCDATSSIFVRLKLTCEQRQSLVRQGAIIEDRRGPNKRVFKIRFRHDGRVIVRYLTTDPDVAELARQELAEIQKETRALRKLRKLANTARFALRQAKAESTPYLLAMGLVYHGYQLRCPRHTKRGLRELV